MHRSYFQYALFRAVIAFSLLVTGYIYIKVCNLQQQYRDSFTPIDSQHHRNRTGEAKSNATYPMGRGKYRSINNLGKYVLPQQGSNFEIGIKVSVSYAAINGGILVELNREVIEVPTYSNALPVCPRKALRGSDNIVLDTLKRCGEKEKFSFQTELEAWLYSAKVSCAGRFISYGKHTAILKHAIVDRSKCRSKLNGGEILDEIVQEKWEEKDEHCKFQQGFFMLPCDNALRLGFRGGDNYLNSFIDAISLFNESLLIDDVVNIPTIALVRFEYYNIYHTMAELYNAFLVTAFLKTTPRNVNVIFVDAHPRHVFDNLWKQYFHSARRVHELARRTLYHRLIWAMPGHSSFLLNFSQLESPPYLEEFVTSIKDRFAIRESMTPKDCQKLRILLVWRQDYVSSLRNPSGNIGRKISNEFELLRTMRSHFPSYAISGTHLEALHFKTQLHKISRTDILIGMHGAGLTHSLFLPKHAGLIELIPGYFQKANEHFKAFSRWRGLKYLRWTNIHSENENKFEGITHLPPSVMLELVDKMVQIMCFINK